MKVLVIAAIVGVVLVLSLLMDRILISYLARKTVKKLLKSKAKDDPRILENPKYGSVFGEAQCLKIRWPNGAISKVLWNEVEEIRAFKKDLITTDLICLAFKKSGKDEYYEIHEEMAGYHDLLEVMQENLPKFDLTWLLDIAFPAFATNHLVIWRRPVAEASRTS